MHDPKSSASSPAKHMAPPRATPFSPKNHPKREAPQPMPATTLAKKKNRLCHRMSPCNSSSPPPDPSRARQQAVPENPDPNRIQRQPSTQSVPPPLHSPGPSRMPPRNPVAAHHFDVSTFRLFDVSTKNHPNREPPQPTPATTLANAPKNFFLLLSPCNSSSPRPDPSRARQQAVPENPDPNRIQRQPSTQSVPPPLHSPGPSRMPPRNAAAAHHFDVSTFRRFDFSTVSPNTCPPQDLQSKKIGCVTICHLRCVVPARGPDAACRLATDHQPGPASPGIKEALVTHYHHTLYVMPPKRIL